MFPVLSTSLNPLEELLSCAAMPRKAPKAVSERISTSARCILKFLLPEFEARLENLELLHWHLPEFARATHAKNPTGPRRILLIKSSSGLRRCRRADESVHRSGGNNSQYILLQ